MCPASPSHAIVRSLTLNRIVLPRPARRTSPLQRLVRPLQSGRSPPAFHPIIRRVPAVVLQLQIWSSQNPVPRWSLISAVYLRLRSLIYQLHPLRLHCRLIAQRQNFLSERHHHLLPENRQCRTSGRQRRSAGVPATEDFVDRATDEADGRVPACLFGRGRRKDYRDDVGSFAVLVTLYEGEDVGSGEGRVHVRVVDFGSFGRYHGKCYAYSCLRGVLGSLALAYACYFEHSETVMSIDVHALKIGRPRSTYE